MSSQGMRSGEIVSCFKLLYSSTVLIEDLSSSRYSRVSPVRQTRRLRTTCKLMLACTVQVLLCTPASGTVARIPYCGIVLSRCCSAVCYVRLASRTSSTTVTYLSEVSHRVLLRGCFFFFYVYFYVLVSCL